MSEGVTPFPFWRTEAWAHSMFLLLQVVGAAVGVSVTSIDSGCSLHRFLSVGLPLSNGMNTVIYLWPGQSIQRIFFEGGMLKASEEVLEARRNEWHEMRIQASFRYPTLLDYIGPQQDDWYSLVIPSMNVSFNISCIGICNEVSIFVQQPATWAFGCSTAPLGCPRDVAEECAHGEPLEAGCLVASLTNVGIPLDGPTKIFWRPLSISSPLNYRWGTEVEWTDTASVSPSEDDLYTWVELNIQSRFVKTENKTKRECNITLPSTNFSADCSTDDNPGNEMLFNSQEPIEFGLGCDEPPGSASASSADKSSKRVPIIVVFLLVILGFSAF